MVRIIDQTTHWKTLLSKFFRFLRSRTMETKSIREMIYSLIFLNGVKPTPSTKQTGKIFQKKMDRSKREMVKAYPGKTKPIFSFLLKKNGAIKRERLWTYR